MKLNELKPNPKRVKASKRIGRGLGSGFGKTSGKGHKGLKSRLNSPTKPLRGRLSDSS